MDVITRNFIHLICSGALNEYIALENMSIFKWKRLAYLFSNQRLAAIALKGIKNHQFDKNLTIPPSAIDILEHANQQQEQTTVEIPKLANRRLNKRFKKVIKNEQHAIDTSVETLQILYIIIGNVNQILNQGITLRNIIDLGYYLRTKGDKVDFIKLEIWLNQLSMQRMAQLQGSILIAIFKFDINEVPFVQVVEKNAYTLAMRSLTHFQTDTSIEWHFKQTKSGFVHNNNKILRRNLRRSMRYFEFAPSETISNFLSNFTRSLAEIEE